MRTKKKSNNLKNANFILLPIIVLILIAISISSNDEKIPLAPEDFLIEDGILIEYRGNSESIIIPEGVIKIENEVFSSNTKIKNVKMPETLKQIGDRSFAFCPSLESVLLNNGLETIGEGAFDITALKEIAIPENVQEIGNLAFVSSVLQVIIVDENNKNFTGVDGVLYNKDMTILLQYPMAKPDLQFTVPDSVVSINDRAFIQCEKIEKVIFNEGLEIISSLAFSECTNLNEIYLPDSVNVIGFRAFSNCEKLEEVYIPESVNVMGDEVFSSCTNLKYVRLPDNLNKIPEGMFDNCKSLQEINIPDNAKIIGKFAFRGCESLGMIKLPKTLEEIGVHAFENCTYLNRINLNNLRIIGEYAFNGCISLSRFSLADDAQYIRHAFDKSLWDFLDQEEFVIEDAVLIQYNGDDDEVDIPQGVKSIRDGAFAYPYTTKKIRLPESYNPEKIEAELIRMESLQSIEIDPANSKYKVIDSAVFSSDYKTLLFYPRGKAGPYNIPAELVNLSIADYAFHMCRKLTGINIGDNVVSIGDGAFASCALREVNIPDSIRHIGNRAFDSWASPTEKITVDEGNLHFKSVEGVLYNKDMTVLIYYPGKKVDESFIIPQGVVTLNDFSMQETRFLKEVIIPKSLRTIGKGAFWSNNSIERIEFSYGLETIEDNAFNSMPKLKILAIPDSVKQIGNGVFAGCNSLEKIKLPSDLTTIRSNCFSGCTSLISIELPKNVTEIQTEAFVTCTLLENINLENVKSIGQNAFYYCYSLENVILSSDCSVGDGAFYQTKKEMPKSESFTVEDDILNVYVGQSEHIIVPEGVVSFRTYSFYAKSLTLPKSYAAFNIQAEISNLESLENINISSGNKMYKSVDGVVFTKDMKELVAFPKGRSGHYTIPEGVEIIRSGVFDLCNKLTLLSIPDSVKIIERQAISNSKILHVDINQRVSRQIDEMNFLNLSWENEGGFEIKDDVVIGYYGVGGKIKIPFGVREIADRALEGKGPFSEILIPETVEKIGYRAFAAVKSHYPRQNYFYIKIEIPETVKVIESEAFAGGDFIYVYWPSSLPIIPDKAFFNCKNLNQIILPTNISNIGKSAFEGCELLSVIHLPDDIQIGDRALKGTPFE